MNTTGLVQYTDEKNSVAEEKLPSTPLNGVGKREEKSNNLIRNQNRAYTHVINVKLFFRPLEGTKCLKDSTNYFFHRDVNAMTFHSSQNN